jgi:hypothetical protein
MARITKASFARAQKALGIKKVTKKNIGRIAKRAAAGGSSSKKTRKSVKSTVTKRRNTVPRRKGRRRGSRKFTIPIAPIVGLAAGLAGPIKDLMDGEVEFAVNKLKYSYLGLDTENKFKPEALMSGLAPLIVGGLVHKFVGGPPLNLNRMLAQANVPIIRI